MSAARGDGERRFKIVEHFPRDYRGSVTPHAYEADDYDLSCDACNLPSRHPSHLGHEFDVVTSFIAISQAA